MGERESKREWLNPAGDGTAPGYEWTYYLLGRSKEERAMYTGLRSFRKGHIRIIGVNLALPVIQSTVEKHYQELIMPISLAAAERCDAVLRIGGESKGAGVELRADRIE